MVVYVAGNEPEMVTFVSGSLATPSTGQGMEITNVSRCGISVSGASSSRVVLPSTITEGWMHARVARTGSGSGSTEGTVIGINNVEGQSIFSITAPNNSTILFQTILGTKTTLGGTGPFEIDVYFKLSATVGILRMFVGGSLTNEVLGNVQFPSGTQAVSYLPLSGPPSGNGHTGQIIVASTPTLGARVHSLPLSTGSVTQWTGTVSNIAGTTSSGTMSETTNNEELSMAAANFATSLQSGFNIDAVILSHRSQALTGSPVTQTQGRTRISGTGYDAGGLKTLAAGYGPFQHVMATNPATAAAWTVAGVDGAEFGMTAKT